MNIHESLLHIFPDYKEGDWEIMDLGQGAFINRWGRPEPQPPAGQINAVTQGQRDVANANARFKLEFETNLKDEALITWIAGKHSLTYAQAIAEIKVIRDSL